MCEMNLQGCQSPLMSCCRKTPPDAHFEASVSRINSFLLSSIRSMGASWNFLFSMSNASWHSVVQFQVRSFFVKVVKGREMLANFSMNLL